ncbi:MAG TPA: nuclear transport factor 2 family protein [Thermoanaerobaculia bacterium]|jgi:ketosteroid isomerase-like protein
MDDSHLREQQALATVDAVWAAYEAGSADFFDFFTEDASIFSLSFPVRMRGRESYRRYFGPYFQEQRRATQVLHAEVRLVGEGALVTYHSRVRVNYNSVDNRTTLLLVPEGDRLKIAHMHMSPLAVLQPSETSGLQEDVAVAWVPQEGS